MITQVDGARCLVRDDNGSEWEVDTMMIDPGQFVWEDGGWVRERSLPPQLSPFARTGGGEATQPLRTRRVYRASPQAGSGL